MGTIEFKIDKESLETEFQEKLNELPTKASNFMDEIAEIYLKEMQYLTPVQTGNLVLFTIIEEFGELGRSIYSTASYFDWIVGGHNVYGPIFSDLQRRWWFWYLNTILGGSYTNKTSGYKGGDDYPLEAFYNSESDVDNKLDEFATWLTE